MKRHFIVIGIALWFSASVQAQPFDADAIMQAVDKRDEGIGQISKATFKLTDRRGKTRVQETIAYRKYYGEEKRQILFYLEPTNVRNTAFLTYDYPNTSDDDDQWLYLPALRKVRRISASDRGDYFLGTDLTYEDLKRQNKVNLNDWTFQAVGVETLNGNEVHVIAGTPVSDAIAKELGYGRSRIYVDTSNYVVMKSEFWDRQDRPLKTIHTEDVQQTQGIWTAYRVRVDNHKTGHNTDIQFQDITYDEGIDDDLFSQSRMKKGVRL